MKAFCDGCGKKHEDHHWLFSDHGNFCHLHFIPTTHEWVPQRIKDERKQFRKDMLQPFRGDTLSSEFCKAYPKIAEKNYGKEAVKKSKEVWKDI